MELLAEMFTERRVGEANKLPLLLVLEAIKALLKIRMSATGYFFFFITLKPGVE